MDLIFLINVSFGVKIVFSAPIIDGDSRELVLLLPFAKFKNIIIFSSVIQILPHDHRLPILVFCHLLLYYLSLGGFTD